MKKYICFSFLLMFSILSMSVTMAGSQAPTVSYIGPTPVAVGGTVYVYGTNFDQNTFVGLDGVNGSAIQPSSITLISPTSLSFVLPSTVGVGTHTLGVAEKAGPWSLSNSVPLSVVKSSARTTTANNRALIQSLIRQLRQLMKQIQQLLLEQQQAVT